MKVSTQNTKIEIRRWFTIDEDHPVVPMAYARPPKEVRIERGYIDYQWKDGRWVCDSSWDVSVSGPVLKKDGTPSKNNHSRSAPHRYDTDPEAWPWLDEIIDLLRPAGDVTLVALYAHVIGDVLG